MKRNEKLLLTLKISNAKIINIKQRKDENKNGRRKY